ncbi:general secretion pathway protein GspN [Rhodanobacter sp. C03]|uniref:general secretion pathway protein GspN n=1 Tax=Rhodanobacter sp. C03 TaxID=1945858 RepID=UPI0009843792|nr:general secretion pathway protein GspN [Rhodanobacter sp. C03]OOG53623.1 general secretion pathway protein GspN [Rhodanobacter sp. C03]
MNAAHQRKLTSVLGVSAVVLGTLWLLLLGGVGRKVHWGAPRALPPLSAVGNAASLPLPLPLEQFAVIWQKPLFSPDRKPVPQVANAGTSIGDLELTGIILTPGLRMALLRDKNAEHHEVRLREGESLPDGSVTLVEVRPRSALFDTSTGRAELKLPAGAPFDGQKTDPAVDTPNQDVPANAMIRIEPQDAGRQQNGPRNGPDSKRPPGPGPENGQPSLLERLRENIQKRRAANAAAANEGVR